MSEDLKQIAPSELLFPYKFAVRGISEDLKLASKNDFFQTEICFKKTTSKKDYSRYTVLHLRRLKTAGSIKISSSSQKFVLTKCTRKEESIGIHWAKDLNLLAPSKSLLPNRNLP